MSSCKQKEEAGPGIGGRGIWGTRDMGSWDMGIGTGIVEVFARLFRSPSSSDEPIISIQLNSIHSLSSLRIHTVHCNPFKACFCKYICCFGLLVITCYSLLFSLLSYES